MNNMDDIHCEMFATCLPRGFQEFSWTAGNAVALGIVGGVFLLMAGVGYFAVRDLHRFGRDAFSWFIAVAAFLIFSGAGFWLGGAAGAVAGVPLLIAFAIGRRKLYRASGRAD